MLPDTPEARRALAFLVLDGLDALQGSSFPSHGLTHGEETELHSLPPPSSSWELSHGHGAPDTASVSRLQPCFPSPHSE